MEVDSDINTEAEEDWPHYLLEYLPTEILFEVFKHLDWKTLCCLSQTCSRFRDLCQKATLWMQLTKLDFTSCGVPSADKILTILQRCPNTEILLVSGVIFEREVVDAETANQGIVGFDKFMLDTLRLCPNLLTIQLDNAEMSDRTVEAISAKCTKLNSISLENNKFISNTSVTDLAAMSSLRKLHIVNCDAVESPSFVIREGQNLTVNLTSISLISILVQQECIQAVLLSCPNLEFLDISASWGMAHFPNQQLPAECGLNTLKTLILRELIDIETLEIPVSPSLTVVDVTHCHSLQTVKLQATNLSTFTSDNNIILHKLELSPCCLSKLSLQMSALEEFTVNSSCLEELRLKHCYRLTSENLQTAVVNKDNLKTLSVIGCPRILPNEINDVILKEFNNLVNLTLHHAVKETGYTPWSNVQIDSSRLNDVNFGSCNNITCLPLNIPTLTSLHILDCRDITESELVDGLLHGKEIHRARGIDGLIKEISPCQYFANNSGVPCLEHLEFSHLPGIQGNALSTNLNVFRKLTKLVLKHCTFLSVLNVENCLALEILKIESCNRLSALKVCNTNRLQSLELRWCSMLQSCTISAISLEMLDISGTNFAHFSVDSELLTNLSLNGVCTQESHTLSVRCPQLQSLSICKSDMLTDKIIDDILKYSQFLTSITLSACSRTRSLTIPAGTTMYSLTAHRFLKQIIPQDPIHVQHLTLNNLPKYHPSIRLNLLKACEDNLEVLEVRAIPGEKEFCVELRELRSLTLDQGIHLSHLEILCPKLTYLRIQGCPNLSHLVLKINKLSQLQIFHSSPLLALRVISLYVSNVKHLARVLTYYCPKLEVLELHASKISTEEIQSLGCAIPHLKNVFLFNCDCDSDKLPHVIDWTVLGRQDRTSLVIHVQ